MALADELKVFVKNTFGGNWTTRNGLKVPDTDDLKMSNDAIKLDATVLYADLAESTGMVDNYKDWFAAEVYKSYLYCAAKVIRSQGGAITAYDGDRVMAVFIGDSKNTSAARCALKITYVVREIIQPQIKVKWPNTSFTLKQKVGVDSSNLFIARTGIRGSNDLVWVGRAANYAAKLAALSTTYSSYITSNVYSNMDESARLGGTERRNMWTDLGTSALGIRIYGSGWQWSV